VRTDGSGAVLVEAEQYDDDQQDTFLGVVLLRAARFGGDFELVQPSPDFFGEGLSAAPGAFVTFGADGRAYRSLDGAQTFTSQPSSIIAGVVGALDASHWISPIATADGATSIAVTADAAQDWASVALPQPAGEMQTIRAVVPLSAQAAIVFAWGNSPANAWRVDAEANVIGTWTGDASTMATALDDGLSPDGEHVYMAGFAAAQQDLPVAFRSSDGGQTFTASALPGVQPAGLAQPSTAVGANARGDVFVVGPLGLVVHSSDFGATFAPVGPQTTTSWTSVAVSDEGAVVIVGADGSVLTHD
jgi:hypothetical protein